LVRVKVRIRDTVRSKVSIFLPPPPTIDGERLMYSGLPSGRPCVVRPLAHIPRDAIYWRL